MSEPAPQHECEWQVEAVAMRAKTAELLARQADLEHQLEVLKRQLFGKKSEKQPAPYKPPKPPADPIATQKKRRDNAEARDQLPSEDIAHAVPPEARTCPKCQGHIGRELPPKVSEEIELIEARFVRRRHVRQVLACQCGECIVEAPPPPRVFDKCHYGPNLCARAIVGKCCDSMPMYRQSKQFGRIGIVVSDRTLVDLFHRSAGKLGPLYDRLMARIAAHDLVQADETPLPVMDKGKTRRAYVWTFLAGVLVGFRYSKSRSGATPRDLLGATTGTLVVDAYTGYNSVCTPEQRERAGCLAHCRRKFADAHSHDEQAAAQALALILVVYRVEHEARELGIAGTPAHRALRQLKSVPAMEAFRLWLEAEKPKHLPQGPMGKAIGYATNQWSALTVFLGNPAVPVDNNRSEAALRVVALGRKNWLWVGNDIAGENMAVLLSLVRTCEAVGVNPQAYLADVLMRIDDWPQSRIDELLPDRWQAEATAA